MMIVAIFLRWCHEEKHAVMLISLAQYLRMLAICACGATVISTAKHKPSKIKARQHLLWSRKQNIWARIAFDLSASFICSFLVPPDWNVFQTEAICHESKKLHTGNNVWSIFSTRVKYMNSRLNGQQCHVIKSSAAFSKLKSQGTGIAVHSTCLDVFWHAWDLADDIMRCSWIVCRWLDFSAF